MNKKIIENAISLSLLQAVTLFLPLITIPYIAIVLGPSLVGDISFSIAAIQIIMTISDYGFNLTGPREIAVHRDSKEKVFDIWLSVTILKILLSFLGALILLLACIFSKKINNNIELIFISFLLVIGNIVYPQWLFQGLEKLKYVSIFQIISRIIIFVLILTFIKSEKDFYLAALIQSSSLLLGGIFSIPFLFNEFKGVNIIWPKWRNLYGILKNGAHTFLTSSAINIYTTSNTFILGFFVSSENVGYYNISEKLIKSIIALYMPISTAIYPYVSRLAVKNKVTLFQFSMKILALFIFIGIILGILIFSLSDILINIFFDEKYINLIPLIKAFSILPLIISISNVAGMLILLPLGMENLVSRILLLVAILNLFVFIPFVYYLNALGAVWASLIVEFTVALVLSYAVYLKLYLPIKSRILN